VSVNDDFDSVRSSTSRHFGRRRALANVSFTASGDIVGLAQQRRQVDADHDARDAGIAVEGEIRYGNETAAQAGRVAHAHRTAGARLHLYPELSAPEPDVLRWVRLDPRAGR
jgi:hypothetical protein